jgi:IstB-like ATP binding protein
VFSEWERIFKDPMTTLAAIDRVVHHAVILDLMAVESYRAREAQEATTATTPPLPQSQPPLPPGPRQPSQSQSVDSAPHAIGGAAR